MLPEKQIAKISKFLSLVLRHRPETIGIKLDENGWVNVDELLKKSGDAGIKFDFDILKYVVATNNKKRFAFNDTLDKIRASQGHSVDVELGYEQQTPPGILYHGTAISNVHSILLTGLEKRQRQHVHLSKDTETAIKVGSRHGKPVVFEVSALLMHNDGFKFFLSENGVWLTDFVPSQYIKHP
jgi:putative RNA 2'-phosphotransferase